MDEPDQHTDGEPTFQKQAARRSSVSRENQLTQLRFWDIAKACWDQTKRRARWFCDPEGPSFAQYARDQLFVLIGAALTIGGILWFLSSLAGLGISVKIPNPNRLYIISFMLLFGATLFVLGRHPRQTELKTALYNEEIDNVINLIEQNLDKLESPQQEHAEREICAVRHFKMQPSEVSFQRLTNLNRIYIDCLDENELEAKARKDLSTYKLYLGREDETYLKFEYLLEDYISRSEHERLRAELKPLQKEIDDEKFLAGQGEAILKSISYWGIPAIVPLFFIGIAPLLTPVAFSGELSVINWGVLGATGAVLSTLHGMRKRDAGVVGLDEGNSILKDLLLGLIVGGAASVLLYVAIRSGVFGGKALPKLNDEIGVKQTEEVRNALSVFWAIVAGFSAKLVETFAGSSQSVTSS